MKAFRAVCSSAYRLTESRCFWRLSVSAAAFSSSAPKAVAHDRVASAGVSAAPGPWAARRRRPGRSCRRVAAGQCDPVGPGPVDLRQIEPAGGQRRRALGPRHRRQDQRVQLGRAAPPARVAGQGGGTGLLVDRAQPEGPGGDLQCAAGALVEGVRGAGDLLGVERGEERAPVGVRLVEGDPDLQVGLALLDLLDAVVAGVARRPVRGVLTVQGPPLRHEVGGADLAPVAPHRLLVQLVLDDLLRLPLDDLGLLQVVRVDHRPALGVQHEELGQHGAGDPVGGGVRVGLEGVEGVREGVHRPAQHTPSAILSRVVVAMSCPAAA